MDEYLRSHHKKVDDDSAEPANPRYRPPQPERLHSQPAKPMFPINPKPQPPTHQPQPVHHVPAPRPAPDYNAPVAKHPAHPKRWLKFGKVLVILLVLAGLGAGGTYSYTKYIKAPTPLPKSLISSTGFAVYYPTKLPGAYQYQPGSASNLKGIFIYKIADGSNGVVINQQAKPSTNFNPSGLPNFKAINVSGGTAVIGKSGGVLTIIYITPTTLINMTAVNNISNSDMVSMAQNLSPVKQPAKLF